MNSDVKGFTAVTVLILLISGAHAFTASFVDESGEASGLDYDNTSPAGFFTGFPKDFESPESIGSNSFTDNSLVSPNVLLSYDGDGDEVRGELDVSYSSFSGDLSRIVSVSPGVADGVTGTAEIEISAFEAIYPGKLYASVSGETAEISNGLLEGDYTVNPDVSYRDESTRIEVSEAFNSYGERVHGSRDFSSDLLVSVVRDGKAVAEEKVPLHGSEVFDTVLEGNDTIYVNNISSLEVEEASPCTTLDRPDTYYIIGSSVFNADPHEDGGGENSCLDIGADDIVVDFADSTLDGDGNFSDLEACGIRISDSRNVVLDGVNVQEFSRGICTENSSEITVNGRGIQENMIGVHSNDSKASLTDLTLSNDAEEYVGVEGSELKLNNSVFDSAEASFTGTDLNVDDASSNDPDGYENTGNLLDVRQGSLENLSFPVEKDSELIYRPEEDETLESGTDDNEIFILEKISSPGLIGTYIESEDDEDDDSGGDGGSGGGGGGGGLPPGPPPGDDRPDNVTDPGRPPWVPAGLSPEDVPRLNISSNDSISVQQGKSFELPFTLDSVGNVSATDVTVNSSVPEGWRSTEGFFEEILPEESANGALLLDIYEGELVGSFDVRLEASTVVNDTFVSLDNETVRVDVEPRGDVRDLYIVEGPFKLNITEGSAEVVGFDLRNSGDYRLENVSVEERGLEECLSDVRGAWSFDEGVEDRFNYTLLASDSRESCEGSFVFSSENEDLLGVVPARINVVEPGLFGKLTGNILPWIVLIWTLLTVYRLRRWNNERKEKR